MPEEQPTRQILVTVRLEPVGQFVTPPAAGQYTIPPLGMPGDVMI